MRVKESTYLLGTGKVVDGRKNEEKGLVRQSGAHEVDERRVNVKP